jgi:tetratricopeptide (TPR) repeat protein
VRANTLDHLGISNLMAGNLKGCVKYYNEAIRLFRELDNRSRLVSSLTGRATSYSMLALLASVSYTSPLQAISDAKEAIHISGEIRSSIDQSWPYWALGVIHTVQGKFGDALNAMQHGLQIAIDIGHKEFELGQQFALGLLFIELLDPDQALKHLKLSQAMAQDLGCLIHIHISGGLLAGAYLAHKNTLLAQSCLDELMSNQTPMDTLGKRLCWVRQAEIAFAQQKPELALDIINQLISSAPGIEPGDVITYLWLLKGEAFHRLGLFDEAISFLQAAINNAQKMVEMFLLWRAHASLGKVYLSTNLPDAAEQEFLTSRSIVKRIAASALDPVIEKKFIKAANNTLSDYKDNIL